MTPLCQCCTVHRAAMLGVTSDGTLLLCERCHRTLGRLTMLDTRDAQLRYLEWLYAAPAAMVDR